MDKYKITFNKKRRILKADSATDAAEKFANLRVFGKPMICERMSLQQYDAETRGERWAQYFVGFDQKVLLAEKA